MSELPYTRHSITAEDERAVVLALHAELLTQGPTVEAFEDALCKATGAPYAVVVNSGTAALHLAYGLLFKPGQWIRMPAISFVATSNAALYCGLGIEFVDTSMMTGLTYTDTEVGVELGGQPTGHQHIIVDACHSFRYVPEAMATILSFHPAKHVTCGEGGAILTGDATLAERARWLRAHGRIDGKMQAMGFNYRMPDLNAALGLSQLDKVQERIAERQRLAGVYDAAFKSEDRIIPTPHSTESHRHLYQVLLDDRDRIQAHLKAEGVVTAIHYPVIPEQPFYAQHTKPWTSKGFPGAQKYASKCLSLPLYPGLTDIEQRRVIHALKEVM